MNDTREYPRRLIEVDLPIKQISAFARSEKNAKEGHISTLHIWWARRPLAACRAVLLAALWPDPADPRCPKRFVIEAARVLNTLRDKTGWVSRDLSDTQELRTALFELIVAASDWDNANDSTLIDPCREITSLAHSAVTTTGERFVVADPFCGGGAIPFEALRVGAVPFASDLNPIPVLLNRTILEFLPKYGERLISQVDTSGRKIRGLLEKALDKFYRAGLGKREGKPFAYFWARTISCEGPGCGYKFPLIRSLWLRNKGKGTFALELVEDKTSRSFTAQVRRDPKTVASGTSKQGSAICPACNFTTPVERVRVQLGERHGGANDAQLLAVCEVREGQVGKQYRDPTPSDLVNAKDALVDYRSRRSEVDEWGRRLPDETLNHLRGFFNVVLYGMTTWGDLLAPRQALLMMELTTLLRAEYELLAKTDRELACAVTTVLALAAGKVAQYNSSCCRWKSKGETLVDMFGRQAIPMVWDFAEAYPFGNTTGDFGKYVENACSVLRRSHLGSAGGTVSSSSAMSHSLPDDSVDMFFTDPPYYDAIPYADLSDYFYVWFRRMLGPAMPELFKEALTPKSQECVVLSHRASMYRNKNRAFFENMMGKAMEEGRRITKPDGIGVVVFANKSTAGWEAMIAGLIEGGWIVTGSWPIDTEMGSRLRARDSAVLSSSVHLVCRPRESSTGAAAAVVGDWREVLRELPKRIHEWLPRLDAEGVVGADAIFACLGPALEVFSKYSRVEKVSGEPVPIREYLEHVWAAVSKEALSMIFDDAEAMGLEEDGRLTAMWLWTIAAAARPEPKEDEGDEGDEGEDDDDVEGNEDDDNEQEDGSPRKASFVLEFDAARKIAQGLGASLEKLDHLVRVTKGKARLLTMKERTRHLFGTATEGKAPKSRGSRKAPQLSLLAEVEQAAEKQGWSEVGAPKLGATILDRLHQAMILFGAGRAEALKRFLAEEGVGKEAQFWKLAQALSALYPPGTDEKRWVDGVFSRKKGLGF